MIMEVEILPPFVASSKELNLISLKFHFLEKFRLSVVQVFCFLFFFLVIIQKSKIYLKIHLSLFKITKKEMRTSSKIWSHQDNHLRMCYSPSSYNFKNIKGRWLKKGLSIIDPNCFNKSVVIPTKVKTWKYKKSMKTGCYTQAQKPKRC